MSSDEQYAETVGKRMTEFPIERRNLLRATGAGLLGTAGAGAAQATGAQETSGGDLVWSFETSGSVSSPTIVDGTVYIGSDDSTLYAVDAATGELEWVFTQVKSGNSVGTAAVADGTVYVGSGDATLYAVDADTGTKEWAFDTSGRVESSPTVADGTVYVGSNGTDGSDGEDSALYAVDAATGSQEWAFTQPSDSVRSSPTVVDGTVYVGSVDETLYAVDAATGTQQWAFTEPSGWVTSSPTVADGTVYVGSLDGTLYAVDAATGTETGRSFNGGSYIRSSPTVADGTVFVGGDAFNNRLHAINTLTGTKKWSTSLPGWVVSSPTVVHNTVFVGNDEGAGGDSLYAVDATDGSVKWNFVTGGRVRSSPTVVDGTVYVGSNDNTLYAIDAGVEGSSEGSRVLLRTLGHHDVNTGQPPDPGTGTVTGQVTDQAGNPLTDVTVEFVPVGADTSEETAATDDSGNYEAKLPADTAYEVNSIKEGYVPETAEVTVKQNTVYTVDFTLSPTGDDPPIKTVTTDDSGNYEVELPADDYEIIVEEAGFEPASIPVSVADGGTSTVDIALTPQSGSTGIIAGTVEDSDGQPIDAGTAYLIDPVYEEAVIDYVAGEESLPNTEAEEAISDGTFSFDSVSTGPHLVVVAPPGPFDSRYMDVSVQVGETATALFTVSAERYLAPLDSKFDELTAAAEGAIERSTADLAPVYVDGAQLFGDDLDEGDFLPSLLDTTAFAFGLASGGAIPISTQIANFVAGNTAIPLAEHGHNQLLEQKITEVEGTEFKQDLGSYASACVETDWITSLDKRDAVPIAEDGFKGTPMYQTALESIDSAVEEYDNIALEEPADDFSFVEVQSVLTEQVRWLKDNGISPGVLITPQGTGYVTREARYHAGHYDTVRTNFDATDALDKASTGLFIAGKGATIVGAAGGVTAAVGAVIAAVGAVGDFVFSMFKVHLKNKLGSAWVDTLMYWLSDLDDAATLLFELAGWIQSEAETPTLQHVDGNINSTDLGGTELNGTTYALANRPDYPFWWPFTAPKPLWRRQGTHTVSVTNTGDVETEFQMIAVDTYGDDGSGGVSDAVSMYPQDSSEGESSTLEPTESAEVEFEYNSNFHPFNPFNWHYMSTALWMNGKAVDEVQDPYYIVPSFDLLPLVDADGSTLDPEEALSQGELEVPIHTNEYLLTDASTSPREAMTVDDWTDNVGEITLLEEGTVDPEQQTLSFEYQTPTDVRGVVFLLTSPMGAELNLSVENNAGQYVGYDPNQDAAVVEIPTAEYNGSNSKLERIGIAEAGGSYQVEATGVRFLTADQASVSVYAAEVPERDASLAVSPGRMDVSVKPGGVASTTLEIAEAGNQVGMDVTDVSVGPFKTPNGATLTDVDISFSETSLSLSAGEETSIELTVDANSSIDLPDGPVTRFQSELTVETTNAGTAVLEASVLVFETDVEGAELTQAGPDVEGVSLTTTDQLPKEPPEDVLVTDQYEIEVVGTGGVSLSFPRRESPDTEIPTAYQVEENGWSELETSAGDRLAVDLPASGVTIIAVTTVQIAPSALPGYENSPQDLDGDGLFEDVDGDGEFTIFDVQAFFTNFQSETVQSNPAAFNFTEEEDPEEVTIFDVQALFRKLS